jgi:type IV pilus assembly protein PilA
MFKFIKKKRNKKGFTLIELIIVIALLGVIAAIAVPRYGNVLENAKKDSDDVTAEMVQKAAELYYFQNPTTGAITLQNLFDEKYIDSATIAPQSDHYEGDTLSITNTGGSVTVTWTE